VALDLKTLIVRRSRKVAGLNLLFASCLFGLAVAVAWQTWRQDEPVAAALMFLVVAAFWGVLMGQQFRDTEPKVIVGRDGLELPGVAPATIPWDKIEEFAVGTGLRAIGGGRLDIFVDAKTYSTLKLGKRWMGDIIVKRMGMRPGFTILGAALDAKTRQIFDAITRHWPPAEMAPKE
jgi:hypothetical protein